jgi:hypothetical protein
VRGLGGDGELGECKALPLTLASPPSGGEGLRRRRIDYSSPPEGGEEIRIKRII